MTRRVLHPSDFSRASRAAFLKAIEVAKSNRAQLLVVHVLTPIVPLPGDAYISPKLYDELAASARAFAQKQLDRLLAQTKKARVRARGFLLEGAPHAAIVRFRAGQTRRSDRDGHPRTRGARQALRRQRRGSSRRRVAV